MVLFTVLHSDLMSIRTLYMLQEIRFHVEFETVAECQAP